MQRRGQRMIDPLTDREIEILRHLSAGMSDREIAQRLYLSLNTVKWHNRHIYSKLGVQGRTQAIAAARRLGLLDTPPGQPPGTGGAPRHNLPAPVTSFVGRERQVAEVQELLASARLVTLYGPPGTGKTRLALRVAAEVLDRFANGVFFIDLAPINDPQLVPTTIAQALGVREGREQTIHKSLQNALRARQVLLLLDNFEQIVEAAPLVTDLLAAAPGLKVLVTSRETLHVYGEQVYPVPPLALPDLERPRSLDRLAACESVDLFLQRAASARPGFSLTAQNAPAVAEICARLGGLPLAIELAGIWVKVLSLDEIVAELQQGFDILATQARDVPERHRSVWAVFDHSWSMLTRRERDALMRLSVFRGNFTREAAGQVAGASLDVLASLVDKSLIRRDPATGLYTIHALLCQFANDRLKENPAAESDTHRRHAAYFAAWLHENEHRIRAGEQRNALLQMHDLRAAWRFAIAERDLKAIGSCLTPLLWLYEFQSWHREGEDLFSLAAETLRAGKSDPLALVLLGQALLNRAIMVAQLGADRDAQALLEEGLDLLSRHADDQTKALGHDFAAIMNLWWGKDTEAEHFARESLALFQSLGIEWGIGLAMLRLGVVLQRRGEFAQADECFTHSLEINRRINDTRGEAWALGLMAEAALATARYDEAQALFVESLALLKAIGYQYMVGEALGGLATVATEKGDFETARDYYLDALRINWEVGYQGQMAAWLVEYADLLIRWGRQQDAVKYLSLAGRYPLAWKEAADKIDDLLDELAQELPSAVFAAEVERGESLQLEAVVAELVRTRGRPG